MIHVVESSLITTNAFRCLIIVLFLFLTGCASDIIVRSSDQKKELLIDGNLNDWSNMEKHFKEDKMSLSIQNNTKTLFLYLRFTDSNTAFKILESGFIIWLDHMGKKRPLEGIRIPGVSPHLMESFKEQNELRKSEDGSSYNLVTKESLIKSIDNIEVMSKGKSYQILPRSNMYGLDVAIANDPFNNGLIYEIAIPLDNTSLNSPLLFNSKPGGVFYIGFESPIRQYHEQPSGFQFGIGMGMGGRMGGMGNNMGYGRTTKPAVKWVEVNLVRAY